MSYTILHNPNCSTSRKGLDLLKEAGIEPDVRKYMNATERECHRQYVTHHNVGVISSTPKR